MLGQVNDKVITPRAQPAQQGSLFGELAPGTKGAPVAPDGVQPRNRRVEKTVQLAAGYARLS